MSLIGLRFPYGTGLNFKRTTWSYICITPFKDYRNQIARMVMKESPIIRLNPMMDPGGVTKEYEGPSI